MNHDIEEALQQLRTNSASAAKPERYYRGEHDLAFATEKFQNAFGSLFREFAMNLCPVICDSVRDKLKITGFGIESAGEDRRLTSEVITSGTRRIWQYNRMAIRSGEVHKEALKNGNAFVIVWPDANGKAAIFPHKAGSCMAVYDEESPGRIRWAAKYWQAADKRIRLNLFYPDRIEKYASVRETGGWLPEAKDLTAFIDAEKGRPREKESFAVSPRRSGSDSIIPNPYGVVPVFHFANNADIGMPGVSELDAAMPVQDGLNKSVLDMLVAMEFSAYRQRWAAGIEIEYDKTTGEPTAPFKAGIDHLWISQNPDAKFGDFKTTDLEQFLKVKDSFRIDLASVTGTPLYYLMPQMKGLPSGESLRKVETRFIAKVRDRQASFGQTWADLMSFALKIEGVGGGIRLITDWEDPAPMSEKEALENILLKKEIGISAEQALREVGYGDADVERMIEGSDVE